MCYNNDKAFYSSISHKDILNYKGHGSKSQMGFLQRKFCGYSKVVHVSPETPAFRIIESLRLEKTSKIIKSNRGDLNSSKVNKQHQINTRSETVP